MTAAFKHPKLTTTQVSAARAYFVAAEIHRRSGYVVSAAKHAAAAQTPPSLALRLSPAAALAGLSSNPVDAEAHQAPHRCQHSTSRNQMFSLILGGRLAASGCEDTTRPVVLWLAEHGSWPERVHIHTANPVGRQ